MVQVQPKQAKYKYTRDLCICHAVARPTNKPPSCGGGFGMFIIFPYVLQVYRKLGVWDVRVGIQMRGTENTALVNRTHWKA
jgi:hypothetical protein